MRNLEPEIIDVLDKIITELDNALALDDKAILIICGDDLKMAETTCGILDIDGWINATRVDQMNYPIYIKKSDLFKVLLASGNYADRAKAEKQNSQSVSKVTNFITAQDSCVAIGDNVTQTKKTTNNFSEKKSLIWIILAIIGAIAGIYTILSYYK